MLVALIAFDMAQANGGSDGEPSFEQFTGKKKRFRDPHLTINDKGQGYINRAAEEKWFSDVDDVAYYVDEGNGLLALKPGEDDENSYRVVNEGDGAVITLQALLKSLSVHYEEFDSNHHFELEGGDGFIIADISDILSD